MPDVDPSSVASVVTQLAENDEENYDALLSECTPALHLGMTVAEIGQLTHRRVANLISLRARLTDHMSWHCSQSQELNLGYTYDQWRTWLDSAVLPRKYVAIAISIWRAHWLANECRPETLVTAQQKARSKQRQYLRSVFKTYVRWEYGNYNLALRETLSEEIALEISRSPAGRRYSYPACLQWLNTATIDREYMPVAISARRWAT